jgi:cation:H+ antiporter
MLLATAAVLAGLIVLVLSSDLFVDGAASIAEQLGMPPAVIGLTIVSLGTSAPEIVVSLIAALTGVGELAVGNALGSNIANVGLVLGLTLIVVPIVVDTQCVRAELPALVLVTLGSGLLLLDGLLSRSDGLLMLGGLALILLQMFRSRAREGVADEDTDAVELPHLSPWRAWASFLAGLLLLIASSRLLVWGATDIAQQLGVSELVIGLTIVAIGTSLPELAATLAGALKGHQEMALGNIVGSNLFNLLAVMPVPGLVAPLPLSAEVMGRDYPAMTAMTVLLALGIYAGRRSSLAGAGNTYLGRAMGLLLSGSFGLYYLVLFRSA